MDSSSTKKKVAIIHYWLLNYRGGERVLRSLCNIYPQADIFTLYYDSSLVQMHFPTHRINSSPLNSFPFRKRYYRHLLPLMPYFLEKWNLRGYDLVISSESGPAKGVITDPEALHVCYCHSPMRYIWDMKEVYLQNMSFFSRLIFGWTSHYMRLWDTLSASRVDYFIANSKLVQKRIEKYYRRDSIVIHPPVDVDLFDTQEKKEDFYLYVGELTSYKKVDLLIEVFNALRYPLVIIGVGEKKAELNKKSKQNIRLLGKVDEGTLRRLYAQAKGFVIASKEDFGISTVEALASGTPVIAYKSGGSVDIVNDKTGVFFEEQTLESIKKAINIFEKRSFKPEDCKARAKEFHSLNFESKIKITIDNLSI